MKPKKLFKNAILTLIIIGLVGVVSNDSFAQQVKKKIIRVIESDGKGEKVVKEYDITSNRQKYDSITREVREKIEIERIKMDSLHEIIRHRIPRNIEIPPIPDVPEPPFFDLGMDDCTDHFFDWSADDENDFEFFSPNFEPLGPKVFYSEKGFEKSGDLDKMLQDLESGTFDPAKYSMKEVEEDKVKDFKSDGKGNIIIIGDQHKLIHPWAKVEKRELEKQLRKIKHPGKGNMFYYNLGSLDNDNKNTIIIKSFNNDSDNEHYAILNSNGKHGRVHFDFNEDGSDAKRTIVITNDTGVKFSFTNPSSDEIKNFEKNGLAKVDESNLLSSTSLLLYPTKEKDEYVMMFRARESGKVKVVLVNDKGKTIKNEEFDYSKGKFEKDFEIKDLNPGVYFIQAQLNNKTTTSKLTVTKD